MGIVANKCGGVAESWQAPPCELLPVPFEGDDTTSAGHEILQAIEVFIAHLQQEPLFRSVLLIATGPGEDGYGEPSTRKNAKRSPSSTITAHGS